MRMYEIFVLLQNGVTASGLVPANTYAEARNIVLSQLNRTDIVSLEVNRV